MNWVDPPKAAAPPIRYHDKQRRHTKGTFPFSQGGLDSGSYNSVDTGEDDEEVLDGFNY